MSTLQITVSVVWVLIALFAIYSVGAAWGGAKAGLQLVFGLLLVGAWYTGIAALLFFTAKAIFGF